MYSPPSECDPLRLPILRVKVYKDHYVSGHYETYQDKNACYIKLFSNQVKKFKPEEQCKINVGVCVKIPSPLVGHLRPPSNLPPFCLLRPIEAYNFEYLPDFDYKISVKNHSPQYSAFIGCGDHIATVKIYYPLSFQIVDLELEQRYTEPEYPRAKDFAAETSLKGTYLHQVSTLKNAKVLDVLTPTDNPTK